MRQEIGRRLALAIAVPLAVFCFPYEALAGQAYTSVGVEGFHDDYKEPIANLDDTTNYGSVTGSYTYSWQNNEFISASGRISYGTDHYSSVSGTSSGAPQWDTDWRIRGGQTFSLTSNTFLSPYIGLGVRYFVDNGKNYCTNLGACGYGRYLTQFYAPIGATYVYVTESDWTISPNLEVDPLLYGNVDTHLGIFPGLTNVTNTQSFLSGYGLRGELMFGKIENSYTWQVGPFARYWSIGTSETAVCDIGGGTCVEPKNTRTQIGLAARVLW